MRAGIYVDLFLFTTLLLCMRSTLSPLIFDSLDLELPLRAFTSIQPFKAVKAELRDPANLCKTSEQPFSPHLGQTALPYTLRHDTTLITSFSCSTLSGTTRSTFHQPPKTTQHIYKYAQRTRDTEDGDLVASGLTTQTTVMGIDETAEQHKTST